MHAVRPQVYIPERWPSRHFLGKFLISSSSVEMCMNFGSDVAVDVSKQEVQVEKGRRDTGNATSVCGQRQEQDAAVERP